jgi:hypothetical protein
LDIQVMTDGSRRSTPWRAERRLDVAKVPALLGLLMITLSLSQVARAQVELGEQPMLTVSGQVSKDQKTATQVGYSVVSLGFTGQPPDKVVWIGVVKAESWDGDESAGRDMIAAVQGYTPSLLLAGKPALVTKIQQAPVGSRIVIGGILQQDARLFSIGVVKVTPPGGTK